MTEKQADKVIVRLSVCLGASVAAYFLTNLHRETHANIFVYTYNTVTGAIVRACEGIKCYEVSNSASEAK
jgi:non-homologous end joining protein Ku